MSEDKRKGSEILKENERLIEEWLEYKIEYWHVAPNTYMQYKDTTGRFGEYILEHFAVSLMEVTPVMVMSWKNSLGNIRNASIITHFAAVRGLYKWLVQEGRLKEYPIPKMKLETTEGAGPHFVPTANDIFKVRGHIKKISTAAIFELMLGSGFRKQELIQLRCCDILSNVSIVDFELQKISPYIKYTVKLTPRVGIRIKRGHSRTVFISKIAGDLLDLYMERNGMTRDMTIPLFPYGPVKMWEIISDFTKLVVSKDETQRKMHIREDGFLDINVDEIDGTEEYKKLIRKAQQAELERRKKFPMLKRSQRREPPRPVNLHPHALRHFFAVTMYYRNFFGNRQDLIGLRDLLGHQGLSNTMAYTTAVPTVTSDRDWRRIFIGNGFDYRSLRYMDNA